MACPRTTVLGIMIFIVLSMSVSPASQQDNTPSDGFVHQRQLMVDKQLRGRDIVDSRVLQAMAAVPRHRFVPQNVQHMAYQDSPLPIGYAQTISQPYIVALMTQLLKIEPGHRVLEIGTGSGYQAAVLAEMGADVFSIEIVPQLGHRAVQTLKALGYENIEVKIGDGYQGWPAHAPFNSIIVTCAPTRIPKPLQDQLAEGGRMVIPAGKTFSQKLYLLRKKDGNIHRESTIDVRFVPMVDEKGKTY
jgi:protein-L-isoaspartate(D-aspartate) O-methyltransferase